MLKKLKINSQIFNILLELEKLDHKVLKQVMNTNWGFNNKYTKIKLPSLHGFSLLVNSLSNTAINLSQTIPLALIKLMLQAIQMEHPIINSKEVNQDQ